MTSAVDPAEGGGPVEQPAPLPPERRRAWAIDTSPLRDPHYRRLFWGVAATMLGQQMTLVAVPYQVYALTGSSLLVGVTSVVALVPLVVFGLLGGAIADSMDRRRLMLVTGAGSAGTSALLAVQALLPGGGNLALLWVLTACVSGFTAVNQPTRSAVIPALVGAAGVPAVVQTQHLPWQLSGARKRREYLRAIEPVDFSGPLVVATTPTVTTVASAPCPSVRAYSSAPRSSRSSESANIIYSVPSGTASRARFRALAGPPFGTVIGMSRSSSARSRSSTAAVSSVEPSSTTMRTRFCTVWFRMLRTDASIVAPEL